VFPPLPRGDTGGVFDRDMCVHPQYPPWPPLIKGGNVVAIANAKLV
jgi:hypothetical protein